MSSVEDQIANKVLQDLYCDIIDQLNVDAVAPRLYSKRRITKSEIDQLHNLSGNLIDQQRKHLLYSAALEGKGKPGLDVFLEVLDDTGIQYDPHALLADKLRAKFKEYLEKHEHLRVLSERHGTYRPLTSSGASSSSVPSNFPDAVAWQRPRGDLHVSPSMPIAYNEACSNTRSDVPVGDMNDTITEESPLEQEVHVLSK